MQANRMFEIIYILLNEKTVTATSLAKRFEVSARTIYRDIEALSAAGIPVYMSKGKGGGISLLPDFVLNKAVLSETEKNDILTALKAVNAVSLEKADTAIGKLSSLFGGQSVDWVEVDFSSWSDIEDEAQTFDTLKTAILKKHEVSFLYHGGSRQNSVRTVLPLKLCYKGQGWYLYAFCCLRDNYRFFKLRRIKQLEVSEKSFTLSAPEKIFTGKQAFAEPLIEVAIKLSEKMAFRVYDEFSDYERLDDGSFIARFSMPRGEWIYNYVASFGAECEVLYPHEIRNEIKETLQKTLSQYS